MSVNSMQKRVPKRHPEYYFEDGNIIFLVGKLLITRLYSLSSNTNTYLT
jgi:hypothetical protein